MRKAAQILAMGAMLAGLGGGASNVPEDYRPAYRKPASKPATMTRKEWKKRKTRLRITKKSRQINRA
ncbi:MAG TPA: hypothetical protein VGK59_18665 [Ohtaekwangia sp.]